MCCLSIDELIIPLNLRYAKYGGYGWDISSPISWAFVYIRADFNVVVVYILVCVCVCVTSFPFPAKSNQKFTLSVHSLKIELLSKLADENKTTTTTTEEDSVVIYFEEKNNNKYSKKLKINIFRGNLKFIFASRSWMINVRVVFIVIVEQIQVNCTELCFNIVHNLN